MGVGGRDISSAATVCGILSVGRAWPPVTDRGARDGTRGWDGRLSHRAVSWCKRRVHERLEDHGGIDAEKLGEAP